MTATATALAPEPLIEVRDVVREFMVGEAPLQVLKGIRFDIGRGEFVSIIGPSGSGKSTLMYQLGCLDTPTSGTVRLAGNDVNDLDDADLAALRNRFIGFVFQSFNLLARTTAVDNVALPLRYADVGFAERRRRARAALERVGLTSRAEHTPERLSGGERQRVAIARAIVTAPELLLCDEPTGNLDQKVGREIIDLFQGLNRETGTTVVIVTHDMSIARRSPRVIRVVDGLLEYDGPPHASHLET
jgi:putative ABC transport system ATP-binding protein